MEMATNHESWMEKRLSSESAAVATIDASPEVQWSEERPSGGKGLISGRGYRGLTLSYSGSGWGGASYSAGGEGRGE